MNGAEVVSGEARFRVDERRKVTMTLHLQRGHLACLAGPWNQAIYQI